ncbi:MAG TPA: sensor histidine kinase [Ramlibacter sp.]|nr:sensor histidine kinase [Ramlibacter sp.]
MNTPKQEPQRSHPPLIEWVLRMNSQVGAWAASMSWWRLIVLFIVITIAASMISDQLHLRHERVKVLGATPGDDEDVQVSISDKEGIVIRRGNKSIRPLRGASSPDAAASSADATPPSAAPADASPEKDDDDEEATKKRDRRGRKSVSEKIEQIFTFRGLIGDLGSALMIIAFAYLVAAKIVVRKVAQADAKVRSAEHAAEHEAMERQLVQARLQVLQAQVEPHFLFNTLSAIDYLIETDPKRASQMQKALITYLRGALPQMRQESSTLGREMRLIKSFLELLKMRMEDRLDVEFAVPEGAESAEFPPMMLQSLVENAIKHGIEPKPEGGKVTVAGRIQNGQLWVEVRDTGIGIHDTERLESATSGTGLGLQNIRERLAMLFPGKSRLILVSDDTQGTTVKIVVPYQVGPETVADIDGLRGKPA